LGGHEAEALSAAVKQIAALPDRAIPLPFGQQLARDARARLVAASGVVLVHATYPPGHRVLEQMGPVGQLWDATTFTVAVTFPVHLFVLLSFLNLAPRVRAQMPARELLRLTGRRLVPAHLFWVAVFLGVGSAHEGRWPELGRVLDGFVFGTAAAHLYFTPLLLGLTALCPLLFRVAHRPVLALGVGTALAGLALAAHVLVAPTQAFGTALVGVAAMAPFALAGLVLAERWEGLAPSTRAAPAILWGAGSVVLVSVVVLVEAVRGAPAEPLALGPSVWLARAGCSLGIPLLLLAAGGAIPSWVLRWAPYTLGIYFVHPLFIVALRTIEARIRLLDGLQAPLVLVNAALALVLSAACVALLARTPLRRVVI
jgi:surface polysaccharide O-acyltransferase-like enzyme